MVNKDDVIGERECDLGSNSIFIGESSVSEDDTQ